MSMVVLSLLCLSSLLSPLRAQAMDLLPELGDESRLVVLPLFFIPQDTDFTQEELQYASELLQAHIELAQDHYRTMLQTDTFSAVDSTNTEYRAPNPNAYYAEIDSSEGTDAAHRILKELFEWNSDDRLNSHYIYLTIYVRPSKQYEKGMILFGSGKPFNGVPNSGGGYIEMEYSSLMEDDPYPFQSTLVHELGHAFGLAHVDCLGHDMDTDDSIMSYNLSHHSSGLEQSADPGSFSPEDYYVLSLNKRAFPDFEYVDAIHNPTGERLGDVQKCFFSPMSTLVGEFARQSGVGYELFWDGRRVNGPESAYYSSRKALDNCWWNIENQSSRKIECSYNGTLFFPCTAPDVVAGDFDGSGAVDFSDFFLFADAFGGADEPYDLDSSGQVDFADFFIFADRFGNTTAEHIANTIEQTYCTEDHLVEFDVHFVVLTEHPDAPTDHSTHVDPGDPSITYTGEELFKREVDILNSYFVDETGEPVCADGDCVRFVYKSHQFRDDLADTSCELLSFGDQTDPKYLDSSRSDYAAFPGAFADAVARCSDERLRDPFAINFYIYDAYRWDGTTAVADPASTDNVAGSVRPGVIDVPFVALDVARLLHQTRSPEEHEMGYALGLQNTCDPSIVDLTQDSNIMQSDCGSSGQSEGARNVGFGADQVASIVKRARAIQTAWCGVAPCKDDVPQWILH